MKTTKTPPEIAEILAVYPDVPHSNTPGMHDILDAIEEYGLDDAGNWQVLMHLTEHRRPTAGTGAPGATPNPDPREEGESA